MPPVVKGIGRLAGRTAEGLLRVEADARTLQAEHVIIATGSEPVRPPVEGLADVPVWTNREATTLADIPQRVLVLGGSAVAVELGQFLACMGAHVTLVERGDRLVTREEPRVGELVRPTASSPRVPSTSASKQARDREKADRSSSVEDKAAGVGSIVSTEAPPVGVGDTFPTEALPFALPAGTERLPSDQHPVVRLRTTPTSAASPSLQESRTQLEFTDHQERQRAWQECHHQHRGTLAIGHVGSSNAGSITAGRAQWAKAPAAMPAGTDSMVRTPSVDISAESARAWLKPG